MKLDYQPGNAPQASAKRTGTNQDKYDILFDAGKSEEKTLTTPCTRLATGILMKAAIRTAMFDSAPLRRAEDTDIP